MTAQTTNTASTRTNLRIKTNLRAGSPCADCGRNHGLRVKTFPVTVA